MEIVLVVVQFQLLVHHKFVQLLQQLIILINCVKLIKVIVLQMEVDVLHKQLASKLLHKLHVHQLVIVNGVMYVLQIQIVHIILL